MAKAKPKKHTAAELKAKEYNATVNRGGGKQGQVDRKGGKVGHSKYKCPIPGCNLQVPDLKTMQIHHESKHSKIPFDPEKCENVHEKVGGITTQGVAVAGGQGKKKK